MGVLSDPFHDPVTGNDNIPCREVSLPLVSMLVPLGYGRIPSFRGVPYIAER